MWNVRTYRETVWLMSSRCSTHNCDILLIAHTTTAFGGECTAIDYILLIRLVSACTDCSLYVRPENRKCFSKINLSSHDRSDASSSLNFPPRRQGNEATKSINGNTDKRQVLSACAHCTAHMLTISSATTARTSERRPMPAPHNLDIVDAQLVLHISTFNVISMKR